MVHVANENCGLAERDYVIDKLRKVLTPGVESNLITPEQVKKAVKALALYTPMWVNKNPTYWRELVKLPIRSHALMKPWQYSLPQQKLSLARTTIDEWYKKGWIIRGESEYIHPLALVTKKNGKTRVCIDATWLNKILQFTNNNHQKLRHCYSKRTWAKFTLVSTSRMGSCK